MTWFCTTLDWAIITTGPLCSWGEGVVCTVGKGGGGVVLPTGKEGEEGGAEEEGAAVWAAPSTRACAQILFFKS